MEREKDAIIEGHYKGNFSNDESLEGNVSKFFKRYIPECNIFIDIGASVGYYTLLATKYIKSGGKIHSFEPDDVLYTHLKKQVENRHNVFIHPYPVSNKEGEVSFYISSIASSGSLVHNRFNNEIDDTFEEIRVKGITIDSFFKSEDLSKSLIKIDVEGGELQVIKGMLQKLKTDRPLVIIEIHYFFLTRIGNHASEIFDIFTDNDYINRELHLARFLFIPKERSELVLNMIANEKQD